MGQEILQSGSTGQSRGAQEAVVAGTAGEGEQTVGRAVRGYRGGAPRRSGWSERSGPGGALARTGVRLHRRRSGSPKRAEQDVVRSGQLAGPTATSLRHQT